MFSYYLKTSLRNFTKYKSSSLINIIGLTIGFFVVIGVALLVRYELSYDSFHANKSSIYRIINGNADDKDAYAGTPAPLGPYLKSHFPEVKDYTRLSRREMVLQYEDKKFLEKELFFADPAFFEIFSFPLVKGNVASALAEPNSMVITEKTALKYFAEENPIGKIISLDGRTNFTVTAIAKDVPDNSHFHFDFVIPFTCERDVLHKDLENSWGNWNYYTYILTEQNVNTSPLKHSIVQETEKSFPERKEMFAGMTFQPLEQIHFKYNRKNLEPAFNEKHLVIFISVALAVLLIACVNFVNLTTANSLKRAKEVGLKKTIGACHSDLIKQFFMESILLTIIAGIFALILIELIMPVINILAVHNYSIDYTDIYNYVFFVSLILLTGVLAGIYPAIVLSSFSPVKALRNKISAQSNISFRNALVIFQFTVSIALIASTIMIFKQVNYIETKNLGFAKDQIINVPLKSMDLMMKSQTLKDEFLRNNNVISASANNYTPSSFNEHWGGISWKDFSESEGEKDNSLWIINADKDFIKTFQIDMLEGEEYASEYKASDKLAFILNESAIRKMNWESAVGKEITYWGNRKANIVGVMKDFHFRSLHHLIEPCAIVLRDFGMHISLRIKTDNIPAALASIKDTWDSFGSNLDFEYYFLDEDFAKLYTSETWISSVLEYFSIIAVFIACIGLYGLTTFMAERRKKELGVRKVLGASSVEILKMFSFDYTKWVILANLLAWPIAWYFMNKWLQNFAYKIDLDLWVFVLSGVIALTISLITISSKAIKAATANPVEALKYE